MPVATDVIGQTACDDVLPDAAILRIRAGLG